MFPDMPLLKSDLGLAAAALLAFTRTMQPDDKLTGANFRANGSAL